MRLSVLAISLAFLAVHLAIAAWVPLFDDEAYYALWARDLALGYYDHPPMIAYMIRLGTSLFGETALGIRLFPVIGFAASGYLVGDMARRMSGGHVGLAVLATALYNLGLLVFALGSFATPDAPSTLFWVAALWAAMRAVNTPPGTRAAMLWWVCTGLLLGFGGLSKFTNAFLAFGLLGYLIATPKGRAYLPTRLPWMAVAAAALPLLPYLAWNLQHDWLGLERQGARLVASGFSIRTLGEYAALLLLAPTPLVSWFALRALRAPPKDGALLVWSAVPLLLYFAYHATHAPVQANWIVPLQAVFAVLAAFGLARAQSPQRWTRATLAIALLMSVGLVAAAFNPVAPIGTADNPPNQTRGWPATEEAIAELLEETGATWIATTDYARTGSLALRFPQVPVWSVAQLQRYGFRGAFPAELCAAPGLLIERARRSETTSETAPSLFETVEDTHEVTRTQAGVTLMRYHLTPVAGLKSPDLCPN
ncbi:glycosyltransferase family 39 protein [Luteimonas sp. RD2P54]|uniref:Glycosyltransferase family 39 protein n=1 Tax=Luteimonas endophytica TaxID=3042023 RepID=A0ABT6J6Q5_9GAMM|nr:glycosyltransferase family 39 protein [Luteimonas endophytica]MDH5822512.1 glycosyltransferase family 39 protein [Luteimonas endophytica]